MEITRPDLAINGGQKIRTAGWQENITTGDEETKVAIEVMKGGQLSLFEGSHAPEKPFSFWGGPHVQN